MKFPKVIFVMIDGDAKEEYLVADSSLETVGSDGDKIAVYELVEVKAKKVTEELV